MPAGSRPGSGPAPRREWDGPATSRIECVPFLPLTVTATPSYTAQAPAVPLATPEGDTADGRRTWTVALLLCALAVGLRAALAPLADPDLPMHLLVGQWIAERGRVPFVEPFAWTRAGEPYYAYSWLAQLLFHGLGRLLGPPGLHLLAFAVGAGATLAGWLAARALGARPAAAAVVGAVGGVLALSSTPFLRPQLLMHAIVPLGWACAARLRERGPRPTPLLGLLLTSAAAAATHITFPVLLAPLALFLLPPGAVAHGARGAREARRVAMGDLVDILAGMRAALPALAAVVGGWLLSPYALVWAAVFRLNFGRNALLEPPSPIRELDPGFVSAPLAGLLLAALPLAAAPALRTWRHQVVLGLLWLAGLLVFARVQKGLSPWWWCALPMTVAAAAALPRASSALLRRVMAAALVLVLAVPAIGDARLLGVLRPLERLDGRRSLPSLKAYAAEPAAAWLEQELRPAARGRLLTTFAYGSYLAWRLPGLSASSDSRTIFPDSVALPDVPARPDSVHDVLGPWRSADLAIVPVTYPVAAVLDTAAGWRRVGVAEASAWSPDAPRAGLWVRVAWWAGAGRTALPSTSLDTLRVAP